MPSIADIPMSPTMSKKRRIGDVDSPRRISNTHLLYEPQIHTDDNQTRHFLPYPKKRSQDTGIKRQRIDIPHPTAQYNEINNNACLARPPLSEMTDHQSEMASEKKTGGRSKESKVDLSPCHICRRKPTEKKQLDAYADCEGCGKRTCFICVRECKGLYSLQRGELEGGDVMIVEDVHERPLNHEGGEEPGLVPWGKDFVGRHRRMICSRCCMEKGTEGEVWCLGCLRMEEGG